MIGKKQILVVDDTAISLAAIERTLSDWYEVVTVNSGVRALKYLERSKPDLILLDIRMANKDGVETLRDMRKMENGKNVPVIMLTSVQERSTVIETSKLGIYDYVLKPFRQDDLRDRVRYVLAKVQTEEREKAENEAREQAELFQMEEDELGF